MKEVRQRPHGEMRRSQMITTFGPGALLDLPDYAVIVGGLDKWNFGSLGPKVIAEERLLTYLKRLLGNNRLELREPPPTSEDPSLKPSGVPVYQFPEWFVVQDERAFEVVSRDAHQLGLREVSPGREPQGAPVRGRPLVPQNHLVKGKYETRDKTKRPVVPIRFVQACKNGHIGDIDWRYFVHLGDPCGSQLWLVETGTSGDFMELIIWCQCGRYRALQEATAHEGALGRCRGQRPWLGLRSAEECTAMSRLLVRHASNAYFSQTVSVIHIPEGNEDLQRAVAELWGTLKNVKDEANLVQAQFIPEIKALVDAHGLAPVFAEIRRQSGDVSADGPPVTIKQAEIRTLLASHETLGEDRPEGDFYARALPAKALKGAYGSLLERVVLVHRLREVMALVGFTRFEPASADVEGELDIKVKRAELADGVSWLPAIENRGEGIFLAFKKSAIEKWLELPAVKAREAELLAGHAALAKRNPDAKAPFPGLPYVMLHSLSHLLITVVALECGYAASSIRERVYASPSGYGILLYTATPDAEGTLGGLVQVGERLHHHLENALEYGRLCANDPVCAQHEPANHHEERYHLGAACHGCLLIAEPSCERRNVFLDRALVVDTVTSSGAAFFEMGAACQV